MYPDVAIGLPTRHLTHSIAICYEAIIQLFILNNVSKRKVAVFLSLGVSEIALKLAHALQAKQQAETLAAAATAEAQQEAEEARLAKQQAEKLQKRVDEVQHACLQVTPCRVPLEWVSSGSP